MIKELFALLFITAASLGAFIVAGAIAHLIFWAVSAGWEAL